MATRLQQLEQLTDRIGQNKALDPPADALARAVNSALEATPLKNALTGAWLGHPLHPALVAIPIGSWSGATALDLLGGKRARNSADFLLAVGIVATAPTVATGLANWSDLFGKDRRIGLVHAASNTVATMCFAAALLQRRRGRRFRGRVLQFAGLGAMTAGGWLGGHLTYRLGVGVDHTTFMEAAADWTTVARLDELPVGKPHLAEAAGVPILLVRGQDDGVDALADTCTHESGPLHEGEVADGCVTCPWHGSQFRLDDGSVVRGPATARQPTLEVRVAGGDVQIKSATA